jgi:hypothetical protein
VAELLGRQIGRINGHETFPRCTTLNELRLCSQANGTPTKRRFIVRGKAVIVGGSRALARSCLPPPGTQTPFSTQDRFSAITSKLPAERTIHRQGSPAAKENGECDDAPHQGVFKATVRPEETV